MSKDRPDICSVNCLKDRSSKLVVDEKGIKNVRKQYMEKLGLMNEENEWEHEYYNLPLPLHSRWVGYSQINTQPTQHIYKKSQLNSTHGQLDTKST